MTDFCGENIKPGFLITREKHAAENWVKFEMKIKGSAGKLSTTIIGDYLTHAQLVEF